jgi:hypothetical protein
MTRILAIVTFCVFALLSQLVLAENDRATQVEQRLEQARAKLGLTDEQFEKMVPVLEMSGEAQRHILSNYGIDLESRSGSTQKLDASQAMAMKLELDVVREDMLAAVEDILTDEQFDEFKRFQKENQAEMRKRIRKHMRMQR